MAGGLAGLVLLVGAACSSTAGSPRTAATNPASLSQAASSSSSQVTSGQTVAKATGRYSTPDLVKFAEPAVVRIQTTSGVGTGFFVSSDGYIMTNNHVVQLTRGTATTVQVTLDDGTVKTGTVKGTDAKSDLALVKIDGSGYAALNFASLENTNVGDDVIAIGYALDLPNGYNSAGSPTITEGIVSAKNRSIDEGASSGTGFSVLGSIQTDAAINHGNSGGPLINYNGEVVGINTSLVPDSESGGAASGIGLAVGSDTVYAVFQQLRDAGKVSRGLLGIQSFQSIKAARAKELGVPGDALGIYLPTSQDLGAQAASASVQAGGPAASAGLQPGDVITKLADQPIHDESELSVALIKHHPGEKVTLEYYRAGQKLTSTVTLGTPPS
jgi:S1-C subfamily serine protease